jgi:hypothetical protein
VRRSDPLAHRKRGASRRRNRVGGLRAWEAADRVPQYAGADGESDLRELGGRLCGDDEDVRSRRGFRRAGSGRSRRGAPGLGRLAESFGPVVGCAPSCRRLTSCGGRLASWRRLLAGGPRSRGRRGCRTLRCAVACGRAAVFRRPGGGGGRAWCRRAGDALVAAPVRPAMRQCAEDVWGAFVGQPASIMAQATSRSRWGPALSQIRTPIETALTLTRIRTVRRRTPAPRH